MKETEERRARSVQRRRELRGVRGEGGAQSMTEEMWTSDESEGEVEGWKQAKRKALDEARGAWYCLWLLA